MQKKQSVEKYLKNTWSKTMKKTQKIWSSIKKGGFLNKVSKSSYNQPKKSSKNKSYSNKKSNKSNKTNINVKSSSGLLPFQLNK